MLARGAAAGRKHTGDTGDTMPVSEGRDLEYVRKRFQDWLAPRWSDRHGGATDVEVGTLTAPEGAGFSNETLLADITWRDAEGAKRSDGLVLRLRPDYPVFPSYDLARQFRIMELLSATPVPMPRMDFVELDDSVVGTAFFVAERVDGSIPGDAPTYHTEGWMASLDPEGQRKVWHEGLEMIARVQEVDWRSCGLDFLDTADANPTAAGIDEYEAFLDWAADGRDYPVQRDAIVWLRENLPQERDRVLVWGDARIGNVIFGPDLNARAVIDWEMATVGSPETDLAWTLLVDWHHCTGYGIERLAALPSHEETVEWFRRRSGRDLENVDYFMVYAALRFAVVYVRLDWLVKRAGLLPEDSGDLGATNPCVNWLRDHL